MELKSVAITLSEECNLILGQTHFIKTVEELAEVFWV
jgi:adenosine/AMP kinase